ncbi:TIM-barrel domain-containing protein [Streptomyces sp. NPDC007264]|uniref:TIM-barrel domain-containing protein n=1 Tax=Streptomyces sp. NPDC007264 TaxID=3364777 RepID=UPI0036DE5F12
MQSASLRQELIPEISIDTAAGFDRTVSATTAVREEHRGFDRITWTARSTGWTKRYRVDVHERHVTFAVEAEGSGRVDTVRYFDAIADNGFREHFALTKHFNDRGRTGPRAYSTGSPISFSQVLCPEPNSHAQQLIRPHEYAQVSVNADLDYNGGNFVADPGLLAFAVTTDPENEWWALGLATTPGNHAFSEFEYLGGEDFALSLNCWGALEAGGTFAPPAIVLTPAPTAAQALTGYVDVLRDDGLVPRVRRDEAPWWHRPIVCGWGHQCYQADLFRIRSSPERPRDNAAYTLCTQVNYQDIVARLDDAKLQYGTLVIDARWFLAGGLKNIDTGRWPDMAGFVDRLHRQGRRVLLWWGPWDAEGLPAGECVRWSPDEALHPNRAGRQAKFGTPTPGAKLGIDITLPQVRARIREQIQYLLGSGPGCVNADGLKIDHQSASPGLYGMVFGTASGKLFGIEAAHEIQRFIYMAAKETKPDALIIGQSPNPYFADAQDMVRLGDIYAHRQDSVLAEMTFRADMARIADPTVLIDTDGWPLPSLAAWREYTAAQPALGVPSLYYVSHLDTTGESLTERDFAIARKAWRSA